MVNTDTIRTVVGIIGNVLSFGLFASPGPTLWRIIKKKSIEEFKADPYIATVVNCLFWVFYGLPMVHPNSTLVVTINGIGLVMELIYLSIFLVYGNKKERVKIGICLMIEMLLICGVGALVLSLKHTHESRSNIVGAICVAFGIIMYGSPLTIMRKVIKTKSVEYMPFHLSLANTLNGTCWVIYGLLRFDLFILIANGAGVVLGLAQLILYAIYRKSTPKDDASKKPPSVTGEVQLPRVESV